ncbi:hypothetical protein ACC724_37790, partial [Rhizobium ruizarguesonis]
EGLWPLRIAGHEFNRMVLCHLHPAIRAGVGIGICQRGLARENPDLVQILPDAFSLPLGTWVAMHERLKSSPRCRATFDVLVKGLQEYLRYSTSA